MIVGAGTLRAAPHHLWTAEYIYPPLAPAYQELRSAIGEQQPPLNVIVSARGDIDLGLRVFASGEAPALIVTTEAGARRLRSQGLPRSVQLAEVQTAGPISAHWIADAVGRMTQGTRLLVEGGPHLLGEFLAERCLDEQFLTLAPQVAGRDEFNQRPGLVAGRVFAPQDPLWGTLTAVKRGQSHLFLRYSFENSDR